MSDTSLDSLSEMLREFAERRDWGQFHTPKNLACALSVEAAELLEIFQWLTEAQSRELSAPKKAAAASEMADVFSYLLHLARALDIDLIEATKAKIAQNEVRYPVDKAKGRSDKYNEL